MDSLRFLRFGSDELFLKRFIDSLHSLLAVLILSLVVGGCGGSYDRPPTESGEEYGAIISRDMMISAAHPEAVKAGLNVLREGGHALDAAVTVQMVLNAVEPPESGLGGGAFLLYYDNDSDQLVAYDGREVAPKSATTDRFTIGSFPLPLWGAVPTGLAVGVPGTLAMLHRAHTDYGRRKWAKLFDPAIRLTEDGIPMPERLKRQIDNDPSLWLFRDTRDFFVKQRRGEEPRLRNEELAETFRKIASEGPDIFYCGELAEGMIHSAGNRWPGGSDLVRADFCSYQPVKREAVCGDYHEWTVCGMPAPSSGGITLLQMLGILEHFALSEIRPGDPGALHLIAEAGRLAYADRARYIGDPAFVHVPQQELIDSLYLAGRASLIDPEHAIESVVPGTPEYGGRNSGSLKDTPGNSGAVPSDRGTSGTSHFSIVDNDGNAVAMTSSIEAPFGSRIMTDGFLLNNQLTDFDFRVDFNGSPSVNAVEAGKRPRSSMAPVIVFNTNGEVRLVIGSRGGSRIIGYVLKALIGVLDWDMPVQKAINLPNVLHRGEYLELESDTEWAVYADTLREMGHRVSVRPLESGLHGIERIHRAGEEKKGQGNRLVVDAPQRQKWQTDLEQKMPASCIWRGGADPRMEGVAKGD